MNGLNEGSNDVCSYLFGWGPMLGLLMQVALFSDILSSPVAATIPQTQ